MDDDKCQQALVTLCKYVQIECKNLVIDRLRKQRHNANQRAHIAKMKHAIIQLEVAFLRHINTYLLRQLRDALG